MQILRTVAQVRAFSAQYSCSQKTLGFVPTMGALHKGHLSLLSKALQECDGAICSLFVNPTQFNNSADLENYPRTEQTDFELLEDKGCTAVFAPSIAEMYAEGIASGVSINFGQLANVLEGAHRPGHFAGVGQVVSRLFNFVQATHAYFGQKDLQQFLLIKQLTEGFGFPVRLRCCPTIRQADGLALSSRNTLLSATELAVAPVLHKALQVAATELKTGAAIPKAAHAGKALLNEKDNFKVEYFEVVDTATLQAPAPSTPLYQLAICVAARLGNVRLIDNILMGKPEWLSQ